MSLLSTLLLASSPVFADGPDPRAAERKTAAVSSVRDLYGDLTALDGTKLGADALVGKAVVFVNVASQCGYTPQYEGLQALYEKLSDRGLVIVGVPCNQFGEQEPGSPVEIANFCKMNYGVTFPLLEKQEVSGDQRSALYDALVGDGKDVRWNFEKFVVNPDGQVVDRFSSNVRPDDAALRQAIEAALP